MAKKEDQSLFMDMVDKVMDRETDHEIDMDDVGFGILGSVFKADGKVKFSVGAMKRPKRVVKGRK